MIIINISRLITTPSLGWVGGEVVVVCVCVCGGGGVEFGGAGGGEREKRR